MDDVTEGINTFRNKATFLKLEGSTCVANEREYVANVYSMLLQGYRNLRDDVKMENRELPLHG